MISNLFLIFKSLFFWFSIVISVLLFGPLVFIAGLLSYSLCLRLSKIWCWYNIYFLKYVCSLNYSVDLENINDYRIIISKHQSAWETLFFTAVVDKPIFILKRELLLIPIFGWCLFLLKNISINRARGSAALNKIMNQCQNQFNMDKTLIIFPEGTRIPYGKKSKIKKGVLTILRSLRADALMVNHNSGLFWSKSSFLIKPGTINVSLSSLKFSNESSFLLNKIEKYFNS